MDHLSVYLDVADSAQLPYGWSRFAHFTLAVVNQYDTKMTVKKGSLSMSLSVISTIARYRASSVQVFVWFE